MLTRSHFRSQRFQTIAALALAAFVLGVLLEAQWRAQQPRQSYATRYDVPLAEVLHEMHGEQEGLKAQLAALRSELDGVRSRAAGISGQAAEILAEIDRLKAAAGMTPLFGPGLTVTLDDAKTAPPDRRDIVLAIVHSTDIVDVLNAAWKAGAEAIAVNGERITGSSACVGATIQINGTLMSPPYVFEIIGPPEQLHRALTDPEELADLKLRRDWYGLGFRIVPSREVRVPSFTGPLAARHARPLAD